MKQLKRALLLGSVGVLVSLAAAAQEAPAEAKENTGSWAFNVRRIGLELSKTDVKNGKEYANSPVSALNADSQTVIKGVWDTVLGYNDAHSRWNNSLFRSFSSNIY